MSAERFYQLIEQYQSDELNAAEWKEFSSILETGAYKTWIDADIRETFDKMEAHVQWDDNLKEDVWNKVKDKTLLLDASPTPVVHRIHFLKTSWFRYAAAVVLIAGGAIAYVISSDSEQSPSIATNKPLQTDIQPGTNKAMLTIGNNRPIDLSSSKTGIAVSNAITYTDGEKIANAGELLTLATPRGGQYQAVLPDGSKVWLNAASSIRFPSKFNGDRREVEISGEAYLEIAKNTKQPFFVHTHKTTVQVLGTSFNINSYADESSSRTTLIEGSVRVSSNMNQTAVLKPGQQAQVNTTVEIVDADINQVIAWKNGRFNFNNADLYTVMRQLSRWYDIEVKYEGNVSNELFQGELTRDLNLSQVLKILGKMEVKFRLEGKTLTVL